MMKHASCLMSPPQPMVDEINNRLSKVLGDNAPEVSDVKAVMRSRGPVLEVDFRIADREYRIHVPTTGSHVRSIDGTTSWYELPFEVRTIISDYWTGVADLLIFNGDGSTIMDSSIQEILRTTTLRVYAGKVHCFDNAIEGRAFLNLLLTNTPEKSLIIATKKLDPSPTFTSYSEYVFGRSKNSLTEKVTEYVVKMCRKMAPFYHPHRMVIWEFT